MTTEINADPIAKTNIVHQSIGKPPARSWRTWLIGRPLQTADAPHQTIGKAVGLAVFASDALSSTAYATQEILFVLAAVGTAAFGFAFPIAVAIVALLAIVTISYEQTIHAYPGGGGAYIVARDNLGEIPAQVAGAALLSDYILTVAVSISAGVAQLVSAFPQLVDFKVMIGVGLVLLIMLINLRGVKESGVTFAIPTYFFLGIMALTVLTGLFRYLTGDLSAVVDAPEIDLLPSMQVATLFLLLHAFSSGTTALTGVEAISNGITAFREPRSRNAGRTLIAMALILGSLFLSITFLAIQVGAVPSEHETVISQLARTIFAGRGLLYLATISATTVILIMAANTAFADFPRLSALQAKDGYLPRQLTYRGSRLVFSRGIVVLALLASLLIVVFNASVTLLIPLYAIGVFISFTLSQSGMAHRWWKSGRLAPDEQREEPGSILTYDRRWKLKMFINAAGAICTAVVTLVFAVTKFQHGAWLVLILTPSLVLVFLAIHRHYLRLARQLSLENPASTRVVTKHRVILPIAGVHAGSLQALRYARSISSDVTAVHVAIEPDETEKIQQKWDRWGKGTNLIILDSPYRLMIEPLVEYIEAEVGKRKKGELITIVVPQFVPQKRWHNLLHTQTAFWLRMALLLKRGVVITEVPYQVE